MYIGLVFCMLAGVIAMWLAGLQNVIGGPIIGLFIGILAANAIPGFAAKVKKGAGFSSKYLLKVGIILVGGTLSFTSILGVGINALPLIVFNICWSFFIARIIGRKMGVSNNTSVLVGGGTAICGGTAIATLSPVVEAKEDEMAYAMTAIFLFDIFAALMWPYAGRALHLSAEQYGILGGLAISDTSSVTAAGATFDAIMGSDYTATVNGSTLSGGDMAVIVKLTRTVMLVFVTLVVMIVRMVKTNKTEAVAGNARKSSFLKRVLKSFPLFVLGFMVMALLNTLIGFSDIHIGSLTLSKILSKGSKYLISVALVGVGSKIGLKSLFTDGTKPILLGGCTWLAVAASTLCYVLIFA